MVLGPAVCGESAEPSAHRTRLGRETDDLAREIPPLAADPAPKSPVMTK